MPSQLSAVLSAEANPDFHRGSAIGEEVFFVDADEFSTGKPLP